MLIGMFMIICETILSWFNKFTTTCSVRLPFPSSGCTACTPENVRRVRLTVQQSPRCSSLRYATALNLSDRSIHQILHEDLGFRVMGATAHTARELVGLL
jgi:hypothetical protein